MTAPARLPAPVAPAGLEAKFFRGLGEPARVRILYLLLDHGEQSVSQLVERVDEPLSRVSAHLACLRSCGYATCRRIGRFVCYRLADERIVQLLRLARSLSWDNATPLSGCQIIDGFQPGERVRSTKSACAAGLLADPICGCACDDERLSPSAIVTAPSTESFGAWLYRHLERRGLSARELAGELGVSASAVRRWLLRGGYPLPELRPRLAEALGVPIEEVRERTRPTGPAPTSPFAAWLTAQLQSRDWTRAELARRLGSDEHTVGAWLAGSSRPRHCSAAKLAAALEVDLIDIPGS